MAGRSAAGLSPSVYDFATIKYSQLKTNINLNESSDLGFRLLQNFPNPFNPSSEIEFEIPHEAYVTIKVFNLLGKEVMTLVNEFREAGIYTLKLNGNNLSGGIYIYSLQTPEIKIVKKFTLIK